MLGKQPTSPYSDLDLPLAAGSNIDVKEGKSTSNLPLARSLASHHSPRLIAKYDQLPRWHYNKLAYVV
jgi:hypothetical protein